MPRKILGLPGDSLTGMTPKSVKKGSSLANNERRAAQQRARQREKTEAKGFLNTTFMKKH